jgi:hypothetical protein
MIQLPAPDGGAESDDALPQWVREAKSYLQGGWKPRDVASHFRCSLQKVSVAFRRHGLPPPLEIYRAALHRRFEEEYNKGTSPIDVATRYGVTRQAYHYWRQMHEALVPKSHKSLILLKKSRRKAGSVETDPPPKQLSML